MSSVVSTPSTVKVASLKVPVPVSPVSTVQSPLVAVSVVVSKVYVTVKSNVSLSPAVIGSLDTIGPSGFVTAVLTFALATTAPIVPTVTPVPY